MIALLIVILVIAALTSLVTVLVAWRWPNSSASRIGLICGLAVPGLILLSDPATLLWIWAKPSSLGSFDTDGMTIVVIGFFAAAGVITSVVVGLPTALTTIRFLRRGR